jgi:hypothetical protein
MSSTPTTIFTHILFLTAVKIVRRREVDRLLRECSVLLIVKRTSLLLKEPSYISCYGVYVESMTSPGAYPS